MYGPVPRDCIAGLDLILSIYIRTGFNKTKAIF